MKNLLLKESPPKDGMEQKYLCGLTVWGSWASRLEQWEHFKKTEVGEYILKLEEHYLTFEHRITQLEEKML
jgi:hypothetical protein